MTAHAPSVTVFHVCSTDIEFDNALCFAFEKRGLKLTPRSNRQNEIWGRDHIIIVIGIVVVINITLSFFYKNIYFWAADKSFLIFFRTLVSCSHC